MENFDKHIKDQLANFEVQPPPGFWHTISDRLDQETMLAPKAVSSFNYARILRIAAVFIGLFSLGTISFLKYTPTSQQSVATLTPAHTVKNKVATSSPAAKIEATAPVVVNAKMATNSNTPKIKVLEATTPIELSVKLVELNKTEPIAENKETTQLEFNLLESNIPVYSLKLLNKKVPSNDEITVIPTKKTTTNSQTAPEKSNKKQQMPWRF
jgi:hypothetical protein